MKYLIYIFKTLIYISLTLLIWANTYTNYYFLNNNIVFSSNFTFKNIILDLPAIFFSTPPPLFLCIIFTIFMLILIFYPIAKKFLINKQKSFIYLLKILSVIINLLLLAFILVNFINFLNGNLWFFSYKSYYFTYFLFISYLILLSLNLYNILHNIKNKLYL